MKRFLMVLGVVLIILIVLAVAGGVFAFRHGQKVSAEADIFFEDFYSHVKAGEWPYIYDNIASLEFQKEMEREKFIDLFTKAHGKLGAISETEKMTWQWRSFGGASFYEVNYKVVYEENESVDHLVIKKNQDDWELLSYYINSNALLDISDDSTEKLEKE